MSSTRFIETCRPDIPHPPARVRRTNHVTSILCPSRYTMHGLTFASRDRVLVPTASVPPGCPTRVIRCPPTCWLVLRIIRYGHQRAHFRLFIADVWRRVDNL